MFSGTVRIRTLASALVVPLVCAATTAWSAQDLKVRSQIVEDLYDTQFVTPNEGWVVGVFGTVYHTTDAGKHWQIEQTPTLQHLYGVAFTDEKNGWAVGRSGEIIHTTDGGKSWSRQQSNTTKHLFKVAFVGQKNGWVVGDWGVVLFTDDGGKSWRDQSLPEDQIVYAIDFADANNGWMVGEFGSIMHTRDGGITWEKQPAPTQKTFFGVAAVSTEKAWAVGIDGLVVRTQDGGAHWELQRGQSEMATFEQIGFMELLKNPGLYDIKIKGNRGYIVGDVGNVLFTEDGGESWTEAQLPAEWRLSWIRGLSVLPDGQGMVVGAAGLTFTVNGKEMHFSQIAEHS